MSDEKGGYVMWIRRTFAITGVWVLLPGVLWGGPAPGEVQQRTAYQDFASSVSWYTDDQDPGFSGASFMGEGEAIGHGEPGFGGWYRLDAGTFSASGVTDTLLEADVGVNLNYAMNDRAIFFAGPSINYVDFDDSDFGFALEAGWRGVFSDRAEARLLLRENMNDRVDDTLLEGYVRLWFGDALGMHLGGRHYLDADVNRFYIGLAWRQGRSYY